MLLSHGTTELNADKIESDGYFKSGTSFFNLSFGYKLGIFGAACFALRNNAESEKFIDLYLKHDLAINLVKKNIQKSWEKYLKQKKEDKSRAVVYVVDAEDKNLVYNESLIKSFFIPNELVSNDEISTKNVKKIMCLDKEAEYFSLKYSYPVESLDNLEEDNFWNRLVSNLNMEYQRVILGKK